MSSTTIHQLTSPRTMQAFLVVLFACVVSALVLQGREVPDLVGWSLAGIIGFYFNTDGKDLPFRNGFTGSGKDEGVDHPPTLAAVAQVDPGNPIVRAAGRQVVRRSEQDQSGPGSFDELTKRERLRTV